ncbi:MAG: TasA family protein [Bacillota bacterium]
MWNRILLGVIGFGFSAFLMGSATMAWFTSSTTDTGTTFTSGTIAIAAARTVAWTEGYNNMAPGQTVVSELTVSNTGTLTMKYRMFGVVLPGSDAGLASALILKVVDPGNGNATLYEGALNAFVESSAIVRDGGNILISGASETLRLEVTLPTTAGNNLAGKTVLVNFEFQATQPENPGWNQ